MKSCKYKVTDLALNCFIHACYTYYYEHDLMVILSPEHLNTTMDMKLPCDLHVFKEILKKNDF